jgi:hypothetical protein
LRNCLEISVGRLIAQAALAARISGFQQEEVSIEVSRRKPGEHSKGEVSVTREKAAESDSFPHDTSTKAMCCKQMSII